MPLIFFNNKKYPFRYHQLDQSVRYLEILKEIEDEKGPRNIGDEDIRVILRERFKENFTREMLWQLNDLGVVRHSKISFLANNGIQVHKHTWRLNKHYKDPVGKYKEAIKQCKDALRDYNASLEEEV